MYKSKFPFIVKSVPCVLGVSILGVSGTFAGGVYPSHAAFASISSWLMDVVAVPCVAYSSLLVALFVLGELGFAPSIFALPPFRSFDGCAFFVASLVQSSSKLFLVAMYLEFIG